MLNLRDELYAQAEFQQVEMQTLPFFAALTDHTLPALAVVSLLRGLSVIYAVLERNFKTSSDQRVKFLLAGTSSYLPSLLGDLDRVVSKDLVVIQPAISHALRIADLILASAAQNQIELIAYFYAMDRFRAGMLVHVQNLQHSLRVKGELSYFSSLNSAKGLSISFQDKRFDSQVINEVDASAIKRKFAAFYHELKLMVSALAPFKMQDLKPHLISLNPEAGRHGMLIEVDKIEAAIRAGNRARERFPYLEMRFGERGRRFTTSDSCWLLSLVPLKYEVVKKNIFWLRGVLSSRGIPTLILETHMRELVFEAALLSDASSFDSLGFRTVITELQNLREFAVSSEVVSILTDLFEREFALLRSGLSPIVPIFASAFADEQSGVPGAFTNLRVWFATLAPADPKWIGVIDHLCERLRQTQQTSRP